MASRAITLLKKHPAYRVAKFELGLYRDLGRWIRGRCLVPDSASPLPHPPGRLQMLGFVTAVLAIEMVVVHLLLPAGLVRLVALLLSLWAVVWVWSLIAGERIRPSYEGPDALVLRRGRTVFAEVPALLVAQRRTERTFASDIEIEGNTLTVGGSGGTDTLLELSEPIEAAGDRYPWQKAKTAPVTRVRFYAGQRGL